MLGTPVHYVQDKVLRWLNTESPAEGMPLCNFQRLCYEIRPADVVLVEGRSRVSGVIKRITHSAWTHSALYIGRLYDIQGSGMRERVAQFYHGDPSDQLVLESILGQGAVVTPLKTYHKDHLRICRPHGLAPSDVRWVIAYTIRALGSAYDTRQLLDLARFLLPYGVIPKRWHSSLFNSGQRGDGAMRTVCSTLIANAFASVRYPILPFIYHTNAKGLRLVQRNPRLFAPRDFDYSPYFDVIKYPYLGMDELSLYRKFPWDKQGMVCNDGDDCFVPYAAVPNAIQHAAKNAPTSMPINKHKPMPDEDISFFLGGLK